MIIKGIAVIVSGIALYFGYNFFNHFTGQKALEKQYQCLLEEIETNKKTQAYENFMSQFKDTLHTWIYDMELEHVLRFKEVEYEISGAVLFDQDKDKALTFLISMRKEGEFFDYVDIITAENFDHNTWHFYYLGNPSMLYDRGDNAPNRTQPIPKDTMMEQSLKKIIKDGYYKRRSCERDYEYFEKQWFPDWIRRMHYTGI